MTHATYKNVLQAAMVLCTLVGFLGVFHAANAAVVRGGETYVFEEEATIDGDSYFAGSDLFLHGATAGDLFAAGNEVTVGGTIQDDALILAGRAVLEGEVGGDARIGGGTITLTGSTTEDVIAVGGTVIFSEQAQVGGNVLIYADEVLVRGTIVGALEVHARSVTIDGVVYGQANVDVIELLTFTDQTYLASGLTYSAPREVFVPEGAVVEGEMSFTETEQKANGFTWMGFITQTLMALFAAVLLTYLFPAFARAAATKVLSDNGLIALKGLGILIAIPVVVVLLAVTMVGLVPALALLLFYMLWLVAAAILAPVLAGVFLARLLKEEDGLYWAWVSLGAIVLNVVSLIAFIGWLVTLVVYLASFGTIGALLYSHVWKKRKGEDAGLKKEIAESDNDKPDQHEEQETDADKQE